MNQSSYLESLFSLSGKVAVVIGGTGELCGAMAEGLAGAGAEVGQIGVLGDMRGKTRPERGVVVLLALRLGGAGGASSRLSTSPAAAVPPKSARPSRGPGTSRGTAAPS